MTHNKEVNGDNNIADDLDKMQIAQLHNATLNFSNNSQETKKLCVTVEVAVVTLITGFYKEGTISNLIILPFLGIFIPFLFYIVDVILYFYQDRLREKMLDKENNIRIRHHISTVSTNRNKHRLKRSFFNGSQVMYFGLILIGIIGGIFCA